MNFDLTDTDWHEVAGLTNGKFYTVQGKKGITGFSVVPILFTQETSTPTDPNECIILETGRFKKNAKNVYVRSMDANIRVNVCFKEVEE